MIGDAGTTESGQSTQNDLGQTIGVGGELAHGEHLPRLTPDEPELARRVPAQAQQGRARLRRLR